MHGQAFEADKVGIEEGEALHLRTISALAVALTTLTLLSGCVGADPKPAETKPSTTCFPGLPKAATQVKAGRALTVTGPGSGGCLVKFTQPKRLVSLTLTGSDDQVLASTSVTASPTGTYTAKLQVPSTYSGTATVRLDSGFRFTCKDTASCAPPTAQVKVAAVRG